jgi:large subunit ribosomal protein L10
MTVLRRKARESGVYLRVLKNTLVRRAVADTPFAGLSDQMVGPLIYSISGDPVAAAKVLNDFAKTNDKLEIVGGSMGTQVLNAEGVKALASMPSLEELRGTLVGLLNAPATKIAQLSTAPAAKLARVFGAYGAKEAA